MFHTSGTAFNSMLPFFFTTVYITRLSRWRSHNNSACQCRRHKRSGFNPWVRKIPWRRKWQSTSVFLPGKSHGQRSLVGYPLWCPRESATTEQQSTHTWMWWKVQQLLTGSDRRDSPITRFQIQCNAEIKEWMLRLCLPAASWGSEDFVNTCRHGAHGKEPACQTQKTCKRLRFDPWSGRSREEGMTTRSSILAWRMPWTEEPGGLQSMGSQRVGHDWRDLAQHPCVTAQQRDPGSPPATQRGSRATALKMAGPAGEPRALTTGTLRSYCRLFKELDFLSSISSTGEEEDSRELSEGLKEGLLLSPWSTSSELGRSSRAWKKSSHSHASQRLRSGPGGLLRQTAQQAWPVILQNLWVWNRRSIQQQKPQDSSKDRVRGKSECKLQWIYVR